MDDVFIRGVTVNCSANEPIGVCISLAGPGVCELLERLREIVDSGRPVSITSFGVSVAETPKQSKEAGEFEPPPSRVIILKD